MLLNQFWSAKQNISFKSKILSFMDFFFNKETDGHFKGLNYRYAFSKRAGIHKKS